MSSGKENAWKQSKHWKGNYFERRRGALKNKKGIYVGGTQSETRKCASGVTKLAADFVPATTCFFKHKSKKVEYHFQNDAIRNRKFAVPFWKYYEDEFDCQ